MLCLIFEVGTKIFVNESLCPYYMGLWNKCNAIKNKKRQAILNRKWNKTS